MIQPRLFRQERGARIRQNTERLDAPMKASREARPFMELLLRWRNNGLEPRLRRRGNDAMLVDMRGEIWKDVDGYGGKYQVNPLGEIRRVCKHKTVLLSGYQHHGDCIVKLTVNRKSKEHLVSRLVAAEFLPCPSVDLVLWHKNGVLSDNFVGNLQWISRRELGKRTALLAARRRTVAKITRDGEVVNFYPSARAAARANNMSYQTVLDRCNNRVKKPFELDNHNYVFSDDLVG